MISTPRLRLFRYDWPHLEAFARGPAELAALLQVAIAEGWPQFPEAFTVPPRETRPPTATNLEWPGLFFIDEQERRLIGSGGFNKPPDSNGVVELGYEIAPGFWGRGFATEAAQGMVDYAFRHPDVRVVCAHTLAEKNASNRVLEKLGMRFTGAVPDPELGEIWRYELART